MSLSEITSKKIGSIVSIKAMVVLVTEVKKLSQKRADASRSLRKRDIQICDINGIVIWVSLWNNLAEEFSGNKCDIYLLKYFKLSFFNGTSSLSSTSFSKVELVILDAQDVDLYQKASLHCQPIDGFSTFEDLIDRSSDEKKYAWIKGKILAFGESTFYDACCICMKKKLTEICEICNKKTEHLRKIILKFYLSSNDCCHKVVAFDSCIQNLFEFDLDYLKSNNKLFMAKCESLVEKEATFRIMFQKKHYKDAEYVEFVALNITLS